ncbi:MAG: Mobile element protein [Candidatus Jettenia ecosi]|uniref:Mobile element protein n=1 Tax=Candidatus Jettenia ecosi TaxID=2494326 RepID=A0A533Q5G7_9BACT|nr:MAG: Mobile element protein [Candidatus Jettenia ecosi]
MLRDLGYFIVKVFREIEHKGAFFLSRFLKDIPVCLSDSTDADAVELMSYLRQKYAHQAIVDMDVYLGKERVPCRLIGYRLSEEIVSQRRRKACEQFRKKGKTPSKEYLSWLEFSWYITNVDRQTWSAEVVGMVYRLRWQIELLFKSWKSLLEIHVLKGTRAERIECFLYGRFISITILTMLYGVCHLVCRE